MVLSELADGTPDDEGVILDNPPLLEEDSSQTTHLPRLYCFVCATRYVDGAEFPVPEAGVLPPEHPLIRDIKQMGDQYNQALQNANFNLISLMNAAPEEDLPADHPVWAQTTKQGSASLEEYNKLRDQIVQQLNLSPSRVVRPYSRVGRLTLLSRIHLIDLTDFMPYALASTSFIVNKRVPAVLGKAGVTGWLTFPVSVTQVEAGQILSDLESSLCELIVVGSGGVPISLNQRFTRSVCPACNSVVYDKFPEAVRLDEKQWDGSDLFHFADHSSVFVTERAKHVMQEAGFSGVDFRPGDTVLQEQINRAAAV